MEPLHWSRRYLSDHWAGWVFPLETERVSETTFAIVWNRWDTPLSIVHVAEGLVLLCGSGCSPQWTIPRWALCLRISAGEASTLGLKLVISLGASLSYFWQPLPNLIIAPGQETSSLILSGTVSMPLLAFPILLSQRHVTDYSLFGPWARCWNYFLVWLSPANYSSRDWPFYFLSEFSIVVFNAMMMGDEAAF